MAISFVDYDSASVTGSGSSTLTVNYGNITGLQDNDLIIAFLGTADGNAANPAWPTQAGYTLLDNRYETVGDDLATSIQYKFASSESGDEVFTLTNAPNTISERKIMLMAFRGVDQTTPFDGVSVAYSRQAGSGNPNPPANTPNTDNAWVVVCSCISNNNISAWGASSGYTLQAVNQANNYAGLGCESILVPTAQLTDPGVWTNTGASTTEESNNMTFVLREGAGGTSLPIFQNYYRQQD